MDEIYETARHFFVWLGRADATTPRAVKVIKDFWSVLPENLIPESLGAGYEARATAHQAEHLGADVAEQEILPDNTFSMPLYSSKEWGTSTNSSRDAGSRWRGSSRRPS